MTPTEIILKHLVMANKLAAKYATQNPGRHDEILSAAYWGLVKAAIRTNPKNSYVAHWIRGEIQNVLHASGSLTASERLFLARYIDCQGNMADRAVALGLPYDLVFHRLATMTFVVPLYDDCPVECPPVGNLDEMLEVCLHYLPAKLHWAFLFKYRDQLSQREISWRTGLTRQTVGRHLRRAIHILRANKHELADILF